MLARIEAASYPLAAPELWRVTTDDGAARPPAALVAKETVPLRALAAAFACIPARMDSMSTPPPAAAAAVPTATAALGGAAVATPDTRAAALACISARIVAASTMLAFAQSSRDGRPAPQVMTCRPCESTAPRPLGRGPGRAGSRPRAAYSRAGHGSLSSLLVRPNPNLPLAARCLLCRCRRAVHGGAFRGRPCLRRDGIAYGRPPAVP